MTAAALAQEFVASTAGRLLIVLLGAAAVAAVVSSVSILLGRRQLRLERRLVGYDVAAVETVEVAGGPETAIVRRGIEYATELGARTGLLERLERVLSQADIPLRAGEVLFYVPVFAAIGFLALSLLVGPVAGLAVAAVVVLGSAAWIERRRAAGCGSSRSSCRGCSRCSRARCGPASRSCRRSRRSSPRRATRCAPS
ncbi:MAG: hypothetical protein KatS3mg009_1064 [Acidimicrobiia bacterium]|nr:MAG: hypothetical protein KatS3mg009_1064 [Acidimicrobiia bacterium]